MRRGCRPLPERSSTTTATAPASRRARGSKASPSRLARDWWRGRSSGSSTASSFVSLARRRARAIPPGRRTAAVSPSWRRTGCGRIRRRSRIRGSWSRRARRTSRRRARLRHAVEAEVVARRPAHRLPRQRRRDRLGGGRRQRDRPASVQVGHRSLQLRMDDRSSRVADLEPHVQNAVGRPGRSPSIAGNTMTADGPRRMRRIYVDWLRGVAVIIMILAHTMDSWTRPEDRTTAVFMWQTKLAGLAAPLFLFLAGLAVAMSGQARLRKGESVAVATPRPRPPRSRDSRTRAPLPAAIVAAQSRLVHRRPAQGRHPQRHGTGDWSSPPSCGGCRRDSGPASCLLVARRLCLLAAHADHSWRGRARGPSRLAGVVSAAAGRAGVVHDVPLGRTARGRNGRR